MAKALARIRGLVALIAVLAVLRGQTVMAAPTLVLEESQVATNPRLGTLVSHRTVQIQRHKTKLRATSQNFTLETVLDLDRNILCTKGPGMSPIALAIPPTAKAEYLSAADPGLPPPGAKYKKTGKSRVILGYKCDDYETCWTQGPADSIATACFAPSAPEAKIYTDFQRALNASAGLPAASTAGAVPEGIPLVTEVTRKVSAALMANAPPDMRAQPLSTAIITVTKIVTTEVPAKAFEIAGCTVKPTPTPVANPKMPAAPTLAVQTSDNDIRLINDNRPRGKNVEAPALVQREIETAARQLGAPKVCADQPNCKYLYEGVFRVKVPGRKYLYVAQLEPYSAEIWSLILFDPSTGQVTPHPPTIWAKWTELDSSDDPDLHTPLISSEDLFHDHRIEIRVEEVTHNGNMYSAVVDNYFAVGADLSLKRIATIETSAYVVADGTWIFHRTLTRTAPNQLRLDSFVSRSPGAAWLVSPSEVTSKSRRVHVGYVILETGGPGTPLHVKGRHAEVAKWSWALVTCAGEDTPSDDTFLRDGYTNNY